MFWRIVSGFRPPKSGPRAAVSAGDAQAPPPSPAPPSPNSLQTSEELRVLGGCHGCSGRLIGGHYEPGAPHAREV